MRVRIAIIGSGTAGKACRDIVSQHTDDYIVVDRVDPVSQCSRSACMPSKRFLYLAKTFHNYRSEFPTEIAPESTNERIQNALMDAHQQGEYFANRELESVKQWAGKHFLKGDARFKESKKIAVGDMEITADYIILAVGAQPRTIPGLDLGSDRVIDHKSIWEDSRNLERVFVLGAGPQGMEFASALSMLGSEVHCFANEPALGAISDPIVQEKALEIFQKQFAIHFDRHLKVTQEGDEIVIHCQERIYNAPYIIHCAGQESCLENLCLENAIVGVQKGNYAQQVDSKNMRLIGAPGVYVCGDSSSLKNTIDAAHHQAELVCKDIFQDSENSGSTKTGMTIVFSNPQIASIGKTYNELKETGEEFTTRVVDFSDQGRSRIERQNAGVLRVYEKEDMFLGAEGVGPALEHLAHLIAWSSSLNPDMKLWKPLEKYHPVYEQALTQLWEQDTKDPKKN